MVLVDRAAGIHRRQHDLIEKMSATLHHTLRQQAVADAASRDHVATPYPVYVDVAV